MKKTDTIMSNEDFLDEAKSRGLVKSQSQLAMLKRYNIIHHHVQIPLGRGGGSTSGWKKDGVEKDLAMISIYNSVTAKKTSRIDMIRLFSSDYEEAADPSMASSIIGMFKEAIILDANSKAENRIHVDSLIDALRTVKYGPYISEELMSAANLALYDSIESSMKTEKIIIDTTLSIIKGKLGVRQSGKENTH